MAYVTVPKDLTKVKSKVVFGLTKRQLICFGGALLVGVPLFFLIRGRVPTSAAALIMVFAMLPGFLLALYEKHGQPLEVVVRQIVECCFIQPKERPYQTNNAYTALMRQSQMEKEVNAIVQKAKERNERKSAGQAHPRRKERDSGRHPKVAEQERRRAKKAEYNRRYMEKKRRQWKEQQEQEQAEQLPLAAEQKGEHIA